MNKKIKSKNYWTIVFIYTAVVYGLKYFYPSVGEFFIQVGYLAIVVGVVYFGTSFIKRR
ncbi:hypothetical protein [Carnobacterium antarcticum]|uniref:Uncharacterized protein n=2 Tax=Carnobacterium TaxID=2747 RepID=A0ABW4NNS1_9LACT|nr:hypothetical protein [Carnobacterium sp. CP1]ALV22526.1 hypothetical protein NY10_1937 [Carnobacterium sp. CP1]